MVEMPSTCASKLSLSLSMLMGCTFDQVHAPNINENVFHCTVFDICVDSVFEQKEQPKS